MSAENLLNEIASSKYRAGKMKLFSSMLPPAMADFVTREAAHQGCSLSIVIRQLIARGITDVLETTPPSWMDNEKEVL